MHPAGIFRIEFESKDVRHQVFPNVITDEGIVFSVEAGLGSGGTAGAPIDLTMKFGARAEAVDFSKNTLGAYFRSFGTSSGEVTRRRLFLKKRVDKSFLIDELVGAWGCIGIGHGFSINPSPTQAGFGRYGHPLYISAFSKIQTVNVWNVFSHDATHSKTVSPFNATTQERGDIFRNPQGPGLSIGKIFPSGSFAPAPTDFDHQTFRLRITSSGDATSAQYRFEAFPFPRYHNIADLWKQTSADSLPNGAPNVGFSGSRLGSFDYDARVIDGFHWVGKGRQHLFTGWDDPNDEYVAAFPVNPGDNSMLSLGTPAKDSTGFMWFPSHDNGLYGGLLRYDTTSRQYAFFNSTSVPALPVLSGNFIGTSGYQFQSSFRRVSIDPNTGILWAVGSNCGLLKFDGTTFTRFARVNISDGIPTAPPTNDLTSLHIASNGDLWLGTNGSGLLKFNPTTNQFTQYTTSNGLLSNYPSQVNQSADSRIWFIPGFLSGAFLQAFDGTSFTNYTLSASGSASVKSLGINGNEIFSIVGFGTPDYTTKIYFSTNGGASFEVDEEPEIGNIILYYYGSTRAVFHRNCFLVNQGFFVPSSLFSWSPIRKYGWNGFAWVPNSASPKTCHLSSQSLLYGTSIRFENSTGAGTQFIAGENFTFTAATGFTKDNTQLVTARYDIYAAQPVLVKGQTVVFTDKTYKVVKEHPISIGSGNPETDTLITHSVTIGEGKLFDSTNLNIDIVHVDGDTGILDGTLKLQEVSYLKSNLIERIDWSAADGDTSWSDFISGVMQSRIRKFYDDTTTADSTSLAGAHYVDFIFKDAVVDSTNLSLITIQATTIKSIPAVLDLLNGLPIRFISGNNRGVIRTITDYQILVNYSGTPPNLNASGLGCKILLDAPLPFTDTNAVVKVSISGKVRTSSSVGVGLSKQLSYIVIKR